MRFAGALGLASWMPALMVIAGLLFMAVEIFLIPGHGVAALLGLLAVLAGIVLSLMGPGSRAGGRGHRRRGRRVQHDADRRGGVGAVLQDARRATRCWAACCAARTDTSPRCRARSWRGSTASPSPTCARRARAEVAGERLDVVSEAGWITAGTPVRVLRAEGYRHVVRAVPLPPPAPADETPAE